MRSESGLLMIQAQVIAIDKTVPEFNYYNPDVHLDCSTDIISNLYTQLPKIIHLPILLSTTHNTEGFQDQNHNLTGRQGYKLLFRT